MRDVVRARGSFVCILLFFGFVDVVAMEKERKGKVGLEVEEGWVGLLMRGEASKMCMLGKGLECNRGIR